MAQLNLLDDEAPRAVSESLVSLMNSMNRSVLYNIGFADKGIDPDWKMKQEMLSEA